MAEFETLLRTLTTWGHWGPDDEKGTLNCERDHSANAMPEEPPFPSRGLWTSPSCAYQVVLLEE